MKLKWVQVPAISILINAQFLSHKDPLKPDHVFLKNHFYHEGQLSKEQAMYILEKGTEILHSEPNVLSPVHWNGEIKQEHRGNKQVMDDAVYNRKARPSV